MQPTPTAAPATPLPIAPPTDVAFTQITVGATHACGLRENATALCWGRDRNDDGVLDTPE